MKRRREQLADGKRASRRRQRGRRVAAGVFWEFRFADRVVWHLRNEWSFRLDRWLVWPADVLADLSPEQLEAALSRFIKPGQERRVAGTGEFAARDEEFERLCPALAEYLTAAIEGEGRQRKTATLLLFAEDGCFKVCLNDRQEALSAWASGSTIQEAIEALEASLQAGEASWRRSAGVSPPPKRK